MVSTSTHSGAGTYQGTVVGPGLNTIVPPMESVSFRFPSNQETSSESKPWVETPVAYLLLQMAIKACFQRTLVEMNGKALIPGYLKKYAENAASRLAKADRTRSEGSLPAHSILEGYSFQDLPKHLRNKVEGEYLIYILSEVHADSLCKVGIAEINSARPFNQYWSALGLIDGNNLLRSVFSEYLIGTSNTIHEAVGYDRRSEEREYRLRRADARGICAGGDPDICGSGRRALKLGDQIEVCLKEATALWPLVTSYIKQHYATSDQPWQRSFASLFSAVETSAPLKFQRLVMLGASDLQKFNEANAKGFEDIKHAPWGALNSWGHRSIFYAAMLLSSPEDTEFRYVDTDRMDWVKLQVNLISQIERIKRSNVPEVLEELRSEHECERALRSLFGFTGCESDLTACVELVRQYSGRTFSQGELREDLVPELLLYSVLPFIENQRVFSSPTELYNAIEDRFLGRGELCSKGETLLDDSSGFLSFLCCLSAFEIKDELERTGLPHFFVFPFSESNNVVQLFDLAGPIARGAQIYISSEHFGQVSARLADSIDESALARLVQINPLAHERFSAEEFLKRFGGPASVGYTFLGNLSKDLDTFYEFQVVVDGPKGLEVCVLAVPKDRCSCIKTKLEQGSEEIVRWVVSLADEVIFE